MRSRGRSNLELQKTVEAESRRRTPPKQPTHPTHPTHPTPAKEIEEEEHKGTVQPAPQEGEGGAVCPTGLLGDGAEGGTIRANKQRDRGED